MNKEAYPQKKNQKNEKKNGKQNLNHHQSDNEPRFAGISKTEFLNWLKVLPTEERYLTLKVHNPKLTADFLAINQRFGDSWKIQMESKKAPTRFLKSFISSLQTFIDGLVLISDKDYLDSIGFDFSFVGCPEKLYETLSNLLLSWNKIKNKTKSIISEDFLKPLCFQKEMWLFNAIKVIQDDYATKVKVAWDPLLLEKQKIEKKQFGNFWKNLSKQNKIHFLYLENEDIQSLITDLQDQGIKIQQAKFFEQINELYDMDKKQICNKIFKCKVKKCSVSLCAYYEILYKTWRQFSAKKKSENKNQVKRKHKPQPKRQKSLGAISNQTNQTQLKDSRMSVSEQTLYTHLQQDVLECVDQISQASNKYHEKRVLAFERISALFRLYGVSCKLFGSCASGITIKDSDIDIAIHQDILQYFQSLQDKKSQMNSAFQFMAQIFQSISWINNVKVIKTAAIPIIKLTINTKVEVTQPYFTQEYQQILNRQVQNGGQVHVDLTIQTKEEQASNHLGIVSTTQINKWLEEIPTLRTIVIMLKYLLAKRSLNQTYLGGLNTYCLVVMAVSFIYSQNLENCDNQAIVLGKMMTYYGWQFDQKVYGIDLRDKAKIYYQKNKNQENKFAQLQVKDPLNQGKVMTRNCYEFEKIKDIMKQIYEKCFIEKQRLLKQQAMKARKKLSKTLSKSESETQSGSEKQKLKNYFLDVIL